MTACQHAGLALELSFMVVHAVVLAWQPAMQCSHVLMSWVWMIQVV